MEQEIKNLRGKVKLQKAAGDGVESEIARILTVFGVRDAGAAGKDMAARLGTDWQVRPSFVDKLIKDKQSKAKGLAGETRRRMQEIVRDVMREALQEDPVPSVNEIARRLRAELNSKGNIEFDAMRAERIARTEMVQDQNSGIFEGMRVAEVDEVEWLAHTDGKSGARRHHEMNGKRVPMGEKFTMPSGAELRYPGDPSGPRSETINCRCTLLPVIRRGRRKIGPGLGSKAKRTAG
jgi:hypothetical protein